MRDHIHPPRVSAPSCIIPPVEDVAVRPYLIPLLPTFHGMENENPYTHIRDFEEVCTTFKEVAFDMDLLKLKAFPLTLKDKAKVLLNSLSPRTIRNWSELQAKFLKKFFSANKTNNLKRKIYTFAAHDSEGFYQYWERYLETISACPHHGFDTWMLVNHFYDGMFPAMKQLLETMCGGDFLNKNPDEAMDFLNYVAETSKGWDEQNPREVERMKQTVNPRGGIYSMTEDVELKAKLSTLNRRMEELKQRNQQEVRAVTKTSMPGQPCFNCQSSSHQGEHCPISPSVRDLMVENAIVVGQNRPPTNAQYGNTYNPNWKNHPNLAWKPKPPVYVLPRAHQQQQYGSTSQQQQPPTSSPIEQAIMNLSNVVGNFVEEQKTINAQLNQRIENVESSMDKRIDGLHKSLNQKIDTLQSTISSLTNQQKVQEQGRFPSQTLPNSRGVHELSYTIEPTQKMDEVQAIITFKSGKEIEQMVPKPAGKTEEQEEVEPEHIISKEDSMKKSMPPPFPQALRGKKKASK